MTYGSNNQSDPELSKHRSRIFDKDLHNPETKFIRNSRTVSGRLHDELVMMDLEHGRYFSLNSAGTRIWDLLEKPMTLDELCVALELEYEADGDRLRIDVRDYIENMMTLGIILTV